MLQRLALRISLSAVALIAVANVALAQDKPREPQNRRARSARSYPPQMPEARQEVYKTIGDVELNLYIFEPKGHKPGDKSSAIVFFFGGGWRAGSPGQFCEQCKYLASRGMVAITADYRVSSRHDTKAVACVADGKSAIRWVRENSKRLGIDPERIVASGGSAGGHVAACTGTIAGFDEEGENTGVSSTPNAMALFNPAVVLAAVDGQPPLDKKRMETLAARMGVEPRNLSPYHQVGEHTPPTIIFHGTADEAVPYKTVQQFSQAMKSRGRDCRLMTYEDQPHGFFNHGREGNKNYVGTLRQLDDFLVELSYLKGPATIQSPEDQ